MTSSLTLNKIKYVGASKAAFVNFPTWGSDFSKSKKKRLVDLKKFGGGNPIGSDNLIRKMENLLFAKQCCEVIKLRCIGGYTIRGY